MPAVISALRKGQLSKTRLRFGKTCRTIVTGNHGTVAAVLTVLTVLFATVPTVRHLLTEYLGEILPVTVQVAFVLLLATLASALFISNLALRSMSPQGYARIMIGGRPASETLQVTSREIERACRDFLKAEGHLKNDKPEPEQIDKLRMGFARQHRVLLNISALLDLASQELDIPLPRLRDHVFGYDPSMHRKYFQKAVQNSELISHLLQNRPEEKSRRDQLLAEIKWIFGSVDEIIRTQEAILTYAAIHAHVLEVAATRSTSDATGRYARAVSYVAQQVCNAIPSGRTLSRRRKEKLVDGLEALRFLVRKQRAHPGFDLHQSCISAFQEAPPDEVARLFPPEEMEKMEETLCTLRKKLNQRNKVKEVFSDFVDVVLRRSKSEADWKTELSRMATLRMLSGLIDGGFVRWRSLLVKRFRNLYIGWCKETDGPTRQNNQKKLLVTHGLSATVRDVFKLGLPLPTEKELQELLPHYVIPNIFVINSGEKGELDSRLMERDLLANKGQDQPGPNAPQEKPFDSITTGHEDTLASFLDKNTRVMVVLGAECFDQKGRVIHPWGLKDRGFRRKLRGAAEICVVVVAEGYKFHEDLLTIPQFYRHHVDRIQLYEPKLVDAFVTTRIMMRSGPDRRKNVAEIRPCGERRGVSPPVRPSRNSDIRDRHILRRPWDHLNMERAVKKDEFELFRSESDE